MYKSKSDLPETLRKDLPENLQEIYLQAYRQSWKEYEKFRGGEADRETVAHRDAMMAVRRDYEFDDDSGRWYPKGEVPQEEDRLSVIDNIKDVIEDL
jgi:cation transport regulator